MSRREREIENTTTAHKQKINNDRSGDVAALPAAVDAKKCSQNQTGGCNFLNAT